MASVLEGGWADLAEGRWEAARVHFEKAVATGATPEAYEGLSWAAWWLDDAPVVFECREAAYRLYRQLGDAAGAARMATWLAADQLDFHGALPVANGWLRRARRLLAAVEPGPDHGWLAFHEGYLSYAVGDAAGAASLAAEAAELGRRFAVADLEMLGLALEGAVHVAGARVADGMRCLDEATAAALEGEAVVPISCAWTCCFLVTACTSVLDYERAFAWCDRIAEFAARYGSNYMLGFCRAEYGTVHLWRGRWDEAEAMLTGSVEAFGRSRPAMAGGPLASLAELRRRQGRAEEAMRLADEAGASEKAQLCRARLRLDAGDAHGGAELLERHLRQIPDDRRLERAPALQLLIRARVERGELDAAASALEALRGLERLVGTPALRAHADLADGLVAIARGDRERGRALLEDAVDGFHACGAPFEAAEARLELATALMALGRHDAGEHEATVAREAFRELGAAGGARRAERILGEPKGLLTSRERDVVALLVEGLTNARIAERLVVSEHTVHRHVANILRKLDAPSRAAAAAQALRAGLLD